jgi:hypothetical protein
MGCTSPESSSLHFPLWAIAIALGLIQTWANRFYMGNDGVSYLDMADAYLSKTWHIAINSSWNPLYSWLIALTFTVFRPNAYWEYPSVQLLNFGIYGLTVASFEYFLRGWLRVCRPSDVAAIRVIGYGAFIWSTLFLVGIWTTNADLLVAASFYAALGLLFHARSGTISPQRVSVMLGIVLAAGYYSKAVMFPISLMFILIAAIVLRWRYMLFTAAVFAVLSIPLIAALSKATDHPTIGDTSRVNYSWYVNGVQSRWWQGGPLRAGHPQHPPQIVLDSPRVYAYGDAFPSVTYPLWYDFAYWYQGVRIWVDPRQLAGTTLTNSKWILKRMLREGGGFAVGLAICWWPRKDNKRIIEKVAAVWPAWVLSIAALLLYVSVHIETRYIGAFTAVILLTAFSVVDIKGRLLSAVVPALGLIWAVAFVPAPTAGARYWPSNRAETNVAWEVATQLNQMGLHVNDKVASVCYSNQANVLWARLARAHIAAETDWNVDYWRLSDKDQQRTLDAMRHSGALIAVSDSPPPDPMHAAGWHRVGSTRYYALSLSIAPGLDQPTH